MYTYIYVHTSTYKCMIAVFVVLVNILLAPRREAALQGA